MHKKKIERIIKYTFPLRYYNNNNGIIMHFRDSFSQVDRSIAMSLIKRIPTLNRTL